MLGKRKKGGFFITTAAYEVPTFGTGEAAEILDVPIWRLQKFLDSQQYNLSPTGKLGEGRGSRRVFTREDLRRIALANWLVKDGFAPQFVGSVVQRLEDNEFDVYINQEGDEEALGIAFYRGENGPVVKRYSVHKGPSPSLGQQPLFYHLDLDAVFAEVDQRIAKLHKGPTDSSKTSQP